MAELTGKIGYRILKRIFRKPVLVLQVEVRGFVPEFSTPSIEGEYRNWWIDANPNLLQSAADITGE